MTTESTIKLDIGCGGHKKAGCIGIDVMALPGVDQVLDLTVQKLPFADQTVSYIFSSHFFEHVLEPNLIFPEITRVAQNGAQLEFWTPYSFSNSAFLSGHVSYLNEDHYLHICVYHPDFWAKALGGHWLFKEIQYIVSEQTLVDLYKQKIPLDYALKYYKEVIVEFGVFMEVRHDYNGTAILPQKTFSTQRDGTKYQLKNTSTVDKKLLAAAIAEYSQK
jgi:ubiquinone/menaquinone biosynthesis C-methylase UbiE